MGERLSNDLDFHNALRHRLIRSRGTLGLSQSELARRSKVSRPIISALESGRGNPSLRVLERLAKAIGCGVGDLLKPPGRLRRSADEDFRRQSVGEKRYSRSGRKPSLKSWLQNPPPQSKTAAAKAFGVDVTLLAENLALSPEQRLGKLAYGADLLQRLRSAVRGSTAT